MGLVVHVSGHANRGKGSFTLPTLPHTHTLAPPTPTRTNSATPTAARRTILISPRSSTGRNSPSTRACGRGKSAFLGGLFALVRPSGRFGCCDP